MSQEKAELVGEVDNDNPLPPVTIDKVLSPVCYICHKVGPDNIPPDFLSEEYKVEDPET